MIKDLVFKEKVVRILTEVKHCFPKCRLFRCAKNALEHRGNAAWCGWTEEECEVANCSYATCVRRRLLRRGICGETVKRKTTEIEPEKAEIPTVKLKGKALRKLGEKEIF